MLTIEEKIARSERFAKLCGQAEIPEWQEECEQFAAWLRELQERRKMPEIIFCHECKHWKDSDGVYRRGISAESKCPVNSRQVYEGTFFCGMAERKKPNE
jgi:argonaute-like protein implicated in RNA metabolism and viral defense